MQTAKTVFFTLGVIGIFIYFGYFVSATQQATQQNDTLPYTVTLNNLSAFSDVIKEKIENLDDAMALNHKATDIFPFCENTSAYQKERSTTDELPENYEDLVNQFENTVVYFKPITLSDSPYSASVDLYLIENKEQWTQDEFINETYFPHCYEEEFPLQPLTATADYLIYFGGACPNGLLNKTTNEDALRAIDCEALRLLWNQYWYDQEITSSDYISANAYINSTISLFEIDIPTLKLIPHLITVHE